MGHRYRFAAEGRFLRWSCERCSAAGGEKTYATAGEASRYATAFDRTDRSRAGSHPTISTLPLWAARKLRGK